MMSSTQSQAHLLRLPIELRQLIFSYFFDDPSNRTEYLLNNTSFKSLSITCKQLRHAALLTWYDRFQLVFRSTQHMYKVLQRIGPLARSCVRRVCLHLQGRESHSAFELLAESKSLQQLWILVDVQIMTQSPATSYAAYNEHPQTDSSNNTLLTRPWKFRQTLKQKWGKEGLEYIRVALGKQLDFRIRESLPSHQITSYRARALGVVQIYRSGAQRVLSNPHMIQTLFSTEREALLENRAALSNEDLEDFERSMRAMIQGPRLQGMTWENKACNAGTDFWTSREEYHGLGDKARLLNRKK